MVLLMTCFKTLRFRNISSYIFFEMLYHLNVYFISNLFLYGVYGMREGEQVFCLFVFLYRQLVALKLLTRGQKTFFFFFTIEFN